MKETENMLFTKHRDCNMKFKMKVPADGLNQARNDDYELNQENETVDITVKHRRIRKWMDKR